MRPRYSDSPGKEAVAVRGWLAAHKWLIARRASQIFFLALFVAGPLAGVWIVKGTLASSLTLGVLPLTDPLMAFQALLAGHPLESTALLGAAIVLVVYAGIGGRMYCSWVCPVNPVTDLAHRLRVRLGVPRGLTLPRGARYGVLGGLLAASLVTGTLAWELVNPVTLLHRELVYGLFLGGSLAWLVVLGVFLFDLSLSQRGFCGHLCPVGAFYGLVGSRSLLRIRADRREDCNDCMDCFAVCPEPHVITPALKGAERGEGPVILAGDCTNCGRCIDVCSKEVFNFGTRFGNQAEAEDVSDRITAETGGGRE